MFDVNDDDLLKDVAGLVDSLNEEGANFGDIAFEDPFELFPKTMA